MGAEVRQIASARWWRPRSLRGRVRIALLLTGLLPSLFLGSYRFFAERQRAVALELSRLSDRAQRLAVFVDKFLAANSTMVKHLSLTAEVVSFLGGKPGSGGQEAMNAWLRTHCSLDPDLGAVLLIRPDGLCVASSEPSYLGANYAFRSYFQDAMAGHSRFTDLQIGMRIPEPFVAIGCAVSVEGVIRGVLLLRINMVKVQQAFASKSGDGEISYLINPDGIFLAHTRPELIYSAIAPIPPLRLHEIEASRQFMGLAHPVLVKLNLESVQAVFRVLATGRSEEFRYTNAGVTRWVALRRLEEEPWIVGVAVNESEIFSHSKRILLLTSLVCLLSLVVVFLSGIWFSRRVLKPLEKLQAAMGEFGHGSVEVRAPEGGGGEVGALGRQFNLMANTIQSQTEALSQRVDTLEGILPICASCRKIRDEAGIYHPLESYLATHTQAQVSHGLCEECARKLYPEYFKSSEG